MQVCTLRMHDGSPAVQRTWCVWTDDLLSVNLQRKGTEGCEMWKP